MSQAQENGEFPFRGRCFTRTGLGLLYSSIELPPYSGCRRIQFLFSRPQIQLQNHRARYEYTATSSRKLLSGMYGSFGHRTRSDLSVHCFWGSQHVGCYSCGLVIILSGVGLDGLLKHVSRQPCHHTVCVSFSSHILRTPYTCLTMSNPRGPSINWGTQLLKIHHFISARTQLVDYYVEQDICMRL